jgi:DNA-binding transcriptional regulator YiaG
MRNKTTKNDRKASVGREIVGRLERFVQALDQVDNLGERFTYRTVKLHLQPRRYTPQLVKKTRALLHCSQSIFAQFLGVSLGAVRDWEQGLKPPGGAARRLMDEIRRHPDYFLHRLKELSSPAA